MLDKYNRRRFLQLTATGIGLAMVYIWDNMMKSRLISATHKRVVLPLTRHLVSFYSNYIVIHKKQHIKVLSSHCTHLGCTINKVENGRLICPCHGSEFDLAGNAVKGPAYRPLPSYPFEEDKSNRQIIVQSPTA